MEKCSERELQDVLALPQMVLEKKYTRLGKRLYTPRELLKEISRNSWVAELVIRISIE
jgi:hypothetical protein